MPPDLKGENNMTVKEARDELLETMHSINKDKLSLSDLRQYAETLKVVSEIQTKTYSECMADMIGFATSGFGSKPVTISDVKGDA